MGGGANALREPQDWRGRLRLGVKIGHDTWAWSRARHQASSLVPASQCGCLVCRGLLESSCEGGGQGENRKEKREKKSKEVSNDTLRRQRVSRMRTLPTVQFCLSTALEGTLELTGCHSTKMREAGSHGRLYLTSRGQTHQAGSSSR